MVKQERAVRTREALVQAAAAAFDCDGFEGASLGRICKAAGISMGALTFHFPTKDDLADAVQARGFAATRGAVERVTARGGPALDAVIALTLELAGLLEKDVTVRAAARLTRERMASGALWTACWLPAVEHLLNRIPESELRPGSAPRTIRALVHHLVAGAEAEIRTCALCADPERKNAAVQLAEIWELALCGIQDSRSGM